MIEEKSLLKIQITSQECFKKAVKEIIKNKPSTSK